MEKIHEFDPFHVEEMGKEEFAAKQAYVTGKCLCMTCPSYVKGDESVGFCFPMVGTSKVIKWEKECLCETCPVYSEYDLTHTYYCTRCSQVCQSYKAEIGAGHE